MKYNTLFNKIKNEKGSLILEATIVFPVTFLVIFILLFLGNIYYQRSKAQAIMTRAAIEAAAKYSNPMVEEYLSSGSIPECKPENHFRPYRYISISDFIGKSEMAEAITEEIKNDVQNMGSGLFSGMEVNDNINVVVDYDNYGIYAMSQVSMTYSITMPIKMLGQTEPYKIDIEEYIEISAMEGSEMVRNVTMVMDIGEALLGKPLTFETFTGMIQEKCGVDISVFFKFIN